jgi:hypothetical protein
MTTKETFKADIERLDIPEHIKRYIVMAGELYATKTWGEGFAKSQEIREKTLSIFNN